MSIPDTSTYYPGTGIPVPDASSPVLSDQGGISPYDIFPAMGSNPTPGISADDAESGATYSDTNVTSGGVGTWDEINELLRMSGSIYLATRIPPGSSNASPDQSRNRKNPNQGSRNTSPEPASANVGNSSNKTIWWIIAVVAILLILGFIIVKLF